MSKIVLDTAQSGYLSTSQINNNFEAIEEAFNTQVLYRSNPVAEPNHMLNILDMNSFKIINMPTPVDPTDVTRLMDVTGAVAQTEQSAADAAASAAEALASEQAAAASAVSAAADAASTAIDAAFAKITWQGVYSGPTAYSVYDAVSLSGSSYICIQAGTGNAPAVGGTAYWDELALKGSDGGGAGDLVSVNNLSDLTSASTARTNLVLGNVDNTTDANKPISIATQAALDGKLDSASPATTATKWATARTLTTTLTGDVTGTANMVVDGTADQTVTVTTVVEDNSHTHDDSTVESLDASTIVSGVLPVTRGGTGTTSSTGLGKTVRDGSPVFTGNPTVLTQTAGDSSTRIASTAFVDNAIAASIGGDTIIATGNNANGYYRLWSDGFKEQWGESATIADGFNPKELTFPVEFTSAAAIQVQLTCHRGRVWSYGNELYAHSETTVNCIIECSANDGYPTAREVFWSACGY